MDGTVGNASTSRFALHRLTIKNIAEEDDETHLTTRRATSLNWKNIITTTRSIDKL
jgi:hypothetical protein